MFSKSALKSNKNALYSNVGILPELENILILLNILFVFRSLLLHENPIKLFKPTLKLELNSSVSIIDSGLFIFLIIFSFKNVLNKTEL